MATMWGGLPGATVRRVGGLHVFASAGPPWLTQVCGLGFEGDARDEALGEALDEALSAAPGALVQVVDGLGGQELLSARGYAPATRLRRLVAVPHRAAVASTWRMAAVGPEAADVVAAVAGEGFGLDLPAWWAAPLGAPGWTQVVAYDGEIPVATGGLHVQDGRGWVGAATTVPAARRRGAQTALLGERLRRAAEQGARSASVKVEPRSGSYRNLLRAGFRDIHGLTQWSRREGVPA